MGKISNKNKYPIKETPVASDFVIGTDSEDNNKTVNFPVNSLSGASSGVTFPFVNLSYGYGNNGDQVNPISFVDYRTITNKQGQPLNAEVLKLIVDIPDFESVKDYNPTLLVDRYRPKGTIKTSKFRKSGYKHETQYHAALNNRQNEFPLAASRTIIDLSPETYFNIIGLESVWTKGIGNRQLKPSTIGGGFSNAVHLGFRLRLTIENKVFESNIFRESQIILNLQSTSVFFRYAFR